MREGIQRTGDISIHKALHCMKFPLFDHVFVCRPSDDEVHKLGNLFSCNQLKF
jgi:hypothetical protein